MIEKINCGVFLVNGELITDPCDPRVAGKDVKEAAKGTIAAGILCDHMQETSYEAQRFHIKFDAMASHDITYVGIIQTARASGLTEFPVPYVLTNCHNSLCAVGGTINEDDHVFGLSAAKKYGGIYVPPHQAVIHQYMREMMAAPGKMIIGSDSHTRYGALGTMAVGEGGPELAKQLLNKTYEIKKPEVVCVYLKGKVRPGVGPQDVALAIIKEVYDCDFVYNKVMEFQGPGIDGLSVDFRNGIDVMTTETRCLSSIWRTDSKVEEYFRIHQRSEEYRELNPAEVAYYDSALIVDLDKIESMIAMPFHPRHAYKVSEFIENAQDILDITQKRAIDIYGKKIAAYTLTDKFYDGKMHVDQGVIAGCSGGTFENLCRAYEYINGKSTGNGAFNLSLYPSSQPVFMQLVKNGMIEEFLRCGAIVRSAFCGPCFGAGDVPSNNGFSIRHTTRNFENREGSRPADGQISWVALMDARSIAATAANHGVLTSASDYIASNGIEEKEYTYAFDKEVYDRRVYNGYSKPQKDAALQYGPNIADWPKQQRLHQNILLEVACVINDPVTTTDELIPSGETSSYRSNPIKLAEFTLSRKDPEYVGRAKNIKKAETERLEYVSGAEAKENLKKAFEGIDDIVKLAYTTQIGSVVVATSPGDGSAREQAASCQKVLGGLANIAVMYGTKRYRSNLINWGCLPFTVNSIQELNLHNGDRIFIKDIKDAVANLERNVTATVYRTNGSVDECQLTLAEISKDEADILLAGCLINYYN